MIGRKRNAVRPQTDEQRNSDYAVKKIKKAVCCDDPNYLEAWIAGKWIQGITDDGISAIIWQHRCDWKLGRGVPFESSFGPPQHVTSCPLIFSYMSAALTTLGASVTNEVIYTKSWAEAEVYYGSDVRRDLQPSGVAAFCLERFFQQYEMQIKHLWDEGGEAFSYHSGNLNEFIGDWERSCRSAGRWRLTVGTNAGIRRIEGILSTYMNDSHEQRNIADAILSGIYGSLIAGRTFSPACIQPACNPRTIRTGAN